MGERLRDNFQLLASTINNILDKKGSTILFTALIKEISNLYNYLITAKECLYIMENKYSNKMNEDKYFYNYMNSNYVEGINKEIESLKILRWYIYLLFHFPFFK